MRMKQSVDSVVELVTASEVSHPARGSRSPLMDTAEWKAAVHKLAAGIPKGKALRIALKEDKLKDRITFKRLLMAHVRRLKLPYVLSLSGDQIFVKHLE